MDKPITSDHLQVAGFYIEAAIAEIRKMGGKRCTWAFLIQYLETARQAIEGIRDGWIEHVP